MQIVTNVALISINETLVVQLISFLIFLFVINRIMFRPLRGTMAEREFYIEEMKSDIEHADKSYEDALLEIKKQEAAVKVEANKISLEHENDGSNEAKKIFESTRAEILQLKNEAEIEVTSQVESARLTIQAESEELAVTIMEKILDRRLTS